MWLTPYKNESCKALLKWRAFLFCPAAVSKKIPSCGDATEIDKTAQQNICKF